MFLYMLKDREKEAFVALARLAAGSNCAVSDEEEIMIGQYCDEMGIAMPEDKGEDLKTVLGYYSGSDIRTKKIVVLEIIGLLFSDGEYDEREQQFIDTVAEALGISRELVERFKNLTGIYLGVLSEMVQAVE